MEDFRLKPFSMALSTQQRDRLELLVEIESKRRGEAVAPSTLFRELGLRELERVLAEDTDV